MASSFADIPRLDPAVRQALWSRDPVEVAKELVGWTLLVGGVGGRIVETEAYHHEDPASHSFTGQTPRNAVMFGPVGRAYVYRSYGIHWCLNFVCGPDPGSAVLIRALQPTQGIQVMAERRGMNDSRALCSGPGKLCQALRVTREHDGMSLEEAPFELIPGKAVALVEGPRIGISKGLEAPWRFGEKGSRYLSRPFPRTPPN